MTTKQVYQKIDKGFSGLLKDNNLAYNLKKVRNLPAWIVSIGKWEHITDPYIQGEVCGVSGNMLEQFKGILNAAIKDKVINYLK